MSESTRFHSAEELAVTLTGEQNAFVLSAFADEADIENAEYFDNYDLPAPIRICVRRSTGVKVQVVLRTARHGSVDTEVRAFNLLREAGLAVPRVILPPTMVEGHMAILTALIEGENLQKLSMSSSEGLEKAKCLLRQAVDRLSSASERVISHPNSDRFPKLTLIDEFDVIRENDSLWLNEPRFNQAYTRVARILNDTPVLPLVLYGDLQPGNFLADGERITGFLDFESAAFRDLLLGLAKYKTHDLHPLNKGGVVEAYLEKHRIADSQFALRVAIFCLKTLDREIPTGEPSEELSRYRSHLFQILDDSISLCES